MKTTLPECNTDAQDIVADDMTNIISFVSKETALARANCVRLCLILAAGYSRYGPKTRVRILEIVIECCSDSHHIRLALRAMGEDV